MIAVLCATRDEAQPLLERIGATPCATPGETGKLFAGSAAGRPLLVVVSGMGPDRARRACRRLAQRGDIDVIVNVGVCGALTPGTAAGDVFTIEAVIDADRFIASGGRTLDATPARCLPGLKRARLGTVSRPVFDAARRDALARGCSLVDMEGFAVARECARLGIDCVLLKGVSDDAGDRARADLHRNLPAVAGRLADALLARAASLPPGGGRREALLSRLRRFTRLEHTLFSLPLLLAGAWLGSGGRAPPPARVLAWIVLAGTGARLFGMAMNRIQDRDLDALNPRTAGRELPSGRLSTGQAFGVAAAGLAAYLGGCAALGGLCLYLSPVPLIPLSVYALLKRFTSLCHFGIGLCLAVAPLGAFVAAADRLPLEPAILLLAGFTLFWMSGFDIIYALQDVEADRAAGIRSLPADLGPARAQAVAAAVHAVAAGLLAALWVLTGCAPAAGAALAVAVAALGAAYVPAIPLPARFFPVSAVAGLSAALVVLLAATG